MTKVTPENAEETLEKECSVDNKSHGVLTRDDSVTRDEPTTPTNDRPASVTVCDSVSDQASCDSK